MGGPVLGNNPVDVAYQNLYIRGCLSYKHFLDDMHVPLVTAPSLLKLELSQCNYTGLLKWRRL